MEADRKYCKMIIESPVLLGDLIKKMDGMWKPDTLIRHLQRSSASIRRNFTFIEFLREKGYEDYQIFNN
nr:hypothetical protein [Elizabethkingia sp. ASV34]